MFRLDLHWQILISMSLGVLFGLLARAMGFEQFVITRVAVLGELFMRGLLMVIVPLIVASIVSGVTSIGSGRNLGRIGAKTFGYYISTSLLAIVTGLLMVNLVAPGQGAEVGLTATPENLAANTGRVGDTLMGIIPTNPFASMVEGDMLPTIFFSLLFGFFILRAADPSREQLSSFFQALFEVMTLMTQLVIRFAPIGVFALIARIIAQTGAEVFVPLAAYMLTVIFSLAIHAFITLPLLLWFIAGVDPIAHARAMSAALLTAFSTASSGATLPLTLDLISRNAGVSNRTSSFVLPLGATINMDGTALYECVAAMFIAQAYGIELDFSQQMIVVLTALLASIGAAAVPMAGLVMIAIVLGAMGLPLEGIGLIIAVDRVLDMLRTCVNVWSDSCGTVLIARSEGETGLRVLRADRAVT